MTRTQAWETSENIGEASGVKSALSTLANRAKRNSYRNPWQMRAMLPSIRNCFRRGFVQTPIDQRPIVHSGHVTGKLVRSSFLLPFTIRGCSSARNAYVLRWKFNWHKLDWGGLRTWDLFYKKNRDWGHFLLEKTITAL